VYIVCFHKSTGLLQSNFCRVTGMILRMPFSSFSESS
jgi:hypothetical protein